MDGQQFDDLTRALATRTSRRRLLKGFAGGVAALVGSTFGRGMARAAPNRCAVFCSQFFSKGPANAACRQACKRCDADISRLCIGPTGASCCEPEAICCIAVTGEEQCVAPCPEGTFLDFETCECLPFVECVDDCIDNVCGIDPLAVCGENPETGTCLCAQTATGDCACVQPICGDVCDPAAPECPDGFVCISEECCGFSTCAPLCDTSLGTTTARATRWGP
jgi:hypothetical protein